MKKRDPDRIIHFEMRKIRPIYRKTEALKAFWEERYENTYRELLDSRNEIGRHGVIVEYITRVIRQGNVLDAGCGTGIFGELLNASSFRYTGIDIAEKAINLAQNKLPNMRDRFLNVRFEEYRPEEKFDVIIANEMVYYMETELFLQQCNRMLAENGHLVISVYDFEKGREILSRIEERIDHPFEISVTNPGAGLKWNIVAGRLMHDKR